MSNSKLEEKHTKILRGLVQLPENKRCADCLAKGPVYANTTFNTFICTTCSGIHREFGFRVKSLSMASFKPEEIKALQEGGNTIAHEKWMKNWNPDEYPEPDAGDVDRIRQFIRLKYVDKRWSNEFREERSSDKRSESRSSHSKRKDDREKVEPLTTILGNNIPPIKVVSGSNGNSNGFNASVFDAAFDSNPPRPTQQPQTNFFPSTNTNFFDAAPQSQQTPSNNFFNTPTQQPQHTHTPSNNFFDSPTPLQSAPSNNFFNAPSQPQPNLFQTQSLQNQQHLNNNLQNGNGLDGILFPSQEEQQKRAQEMQRKKEEQEKLQKATLLQQQLGQMYQQAAVHNQFAQQQMMQQMFMQQQQQQQHMMQNPNQQNQQFNPMMGGMPGGMPGGQMHMQGMPQQMQGIPHQMHNPQQGGWPMTQNGGMHSLPPQQSSNMFGLEPEVQPTTTHAPKEPPKPDPFAALSPFTLGGGKPINATKSPPSSVNDFGNFQNRNQQVQQPSNNNMDDFFGITPQKVQPSPQVQTDSNPFFF